MTTPRFLAALLAPAGVLLAHAISSAVWHASAARGLASHQGLALLAGWGALGALIVLVVAALASHRAALPRADVRWLLGLQAGVYVASEVAEALDGVGGLPSLHDRTVWLGLAAQVLAGVAVSATGYLIAALVRRIVSARTPRTCTWEPVSGRCSAVSRVASATGVRSRSVRGPPVLAGAA